MPHLVHRRRCHPRRTAAVSPAAFADSLTWTILIMEITFCSIHFMLQFINFTPLWTFWRNTINSCSNIFYLRVVSLFIFALHWPLVVIRVYYCWSVFRHLLPCGLCMEAYLSHDSKLKSINYRTLPYSLLNTFSFMIWSKYDVYFVSGINSVIPGLKEMLHPIHHISNNP